MREHLEIRELGGVPVDYDGFAARLADIDRLELSCGASGPAADALRSCVESSTLGCWVAADCDGVAMLFGLAPYPGCADTGVPWLLMATTARARHRRALLRTGREFLRRYLRLRPRLVNLVHQRNAAAIRWLRALGFTVHPPAMSVTVDGHPFLPFTYGMS